MRKNMMSLLGIFIALGSAWADESVDDQLRRAFAGEDAPLRAPIKLVWKDQGAIFTAANSAFVPDTGQVRLTDCYVTRSPAGPAPDARPVSIRARRVVLTYDAPVRRMADLSGRKLVWVSADLDDGVRLDLTRR
jgi:hypothetical protein